MKDNPNKISTKKNSWKLYIQKKILEYLKNISIVNQKKKKENKGEKNSNRIKIIDSRKKEKMFSMETKEKIKLSEKRVHNKKNLEKS